jgi:hypothetical protein
MQAAYVRYLTSKLGFAKLSSSPQPGSTRSLIINGRPAADDIDLHRGSTRMPFFYSHLHAPQSINCKICTVFFIIVAYQAHHTSRGVSLDAAATLS